MRGTAGKVGGRAVAARPALASTHPPPLRPAAAHLVVGLLSQEIGINFRNRWNELGRGRERLRETVWLSYRSCVQVPPPPQRHSLLCGCS